MVISTVYENQLTKPAIVDTGAPYCVVSSEIATLLNLDHSMALETLSLRIRGDIYHGYLHLMTISLDAEIGIELDIQATAFVPNTATGQPLLDLNFLGLSGFLDRLCYAVNPTTNTFYFAGL